MAPYNNLVLLQRHFDMNIFFITYPILIIAIGIKNMCNCTSLLYLVIIFAYSGWTLLLTINYYCIIEIDYTLKTSVYLLQISKVTKIGLFFSHPATDCV